MPRLTASIVGLETMSAGAMFHSLMDAGNNNNVGRQSPGCGVGGTTSRMYIDDKIPNTVIST